MGNKNNIHNNNIRIKNINVNINNIIDNIIINIIIIIISQIFLI